MKKILFYTTCISLLMLASCREEDALMSAEDTATLKIVQDNTKQNSAPTLKVIDSTKSRTSATMYGDPLRPPK